MYDTTHWVDHVTSPNNCFTITDNHDGTYTIARAGTVMQQGTPQDAAHFGNIESGIYEAHAVLGLLINYARQNAWEIERGSIDLTNTAQYPFNNSQQTVVLDAPRPSGDYIVIADAVNSVGCPGQVEVSDKLSNGFKIRYTGGASSATINYIVIGGFLK